MRTKVFVALATAAVAGLWAMPAAADLLVSEPFGYDLGSNFSGQNGGVGFNAGAAGAWTAATLDPANTVTLTSVAGLTFGGYPTSGNAGRITMNYVSGDTAAIPFREIGATGAQTVWFSYLYRFEGGNLQGWESLGVHPQVRKPYPDNSNGTFRGIALAWRGTDSISRGGVSIGTALVAYDEVNNPSALVDGSTRMILCRITGTGGNYTSGNYWALSAANWDAINARGFVDETSIGTDFVQASTLDASGSPGTVFLPGDALEWKMRGSAAAPTVVTLDEIRIGTTLADVAVPEPGSITVLAIGALGLLRRRKQA